MCDAYIVQYGETNPFTRQPYTAKYKKILESRKNLPVYAQMEDFYRIVSSLEFRPHRGAIISGKLKLTFDKTFLLAWTRVIY
jgi:HrpA-like RNA helicase